MIKIKIAVTVLENDGDVTTVEIITEEPYQLIESHNFKKTRLLKTKEIMTGMKSDRICHNLKFNSPVRNQGFDFAPGTASRNTWCQC